jgi:hypothetical protein
MECMVLIVLVNPVMMAKTAIGIPSDAVPLIHTMLTVAGLYIRLSRRFLPSTLHFMEYIILGLFLEKVDIWIRRHCFRGGWRNTFKTSHRSRCLVSLLGFVVLL